MSDGPKKNPCKFLTYKGFQVASSTGGEGGIRTHGRVAPTLDFESNALLNIVLIQQLKTQNQVFANSLQN
jgi:hypothetical protein